MQLELSEPKIPKVIMTSTRRHILLKIQSGASNILRMDIERKPTPIGYRPVKVWYVRSFSQPNCWREKTSVVKKMFKIGLIRKLPSDQIILTTLATNILEDTKSESIRLFGVLPLEDLTANSISPVQESYSPLPYETFPLDKW